MRNELPTGKVWKSKELKGTYYSKPLPSSPLAQAATLSTLGLSLPIATTVSLPIASTSSLLQLQLLWPSPQPPPDPFHQSGVEQANAYVLKGAEQVLFPLIDSCQRLNDHEAILSVVSIATEEFCMAWLNVILEKGIKFRLVFGWVSGG